MRKLFNILYCLAAAATLALAAGCSDNDASYKESGSSDGGGQGGSMACFTIAGNYMYTVDNSKMKVASLANPAKPAKVSEYTLSGMGIHGDIETIFHYDSKLFIGSRSAMYVMDISENPGMPRMLTAVSHFRSCDPVVAYGDRAYVTLNNARINCGSSGDYLMIYDISNLENEATDYYYNRVSLLPGGTIEFTGGIHPAGLGVDGAAGKLFVCTNTGILVFELQEDEDNPVKYISDLRDIPNVGVIDAYDVIPMSGHLIAIGNSGLFQFDYTEEEITLISKFDLRK